MILAVRCNKEVVPTHKASGQALSFNGQQIELRKA